MIDDNDSKIVRLLLDDGRMSHEAIARRTNFSRPAIHQRIAKLTEQETIKGYSAKINWADLGYSIDAFVFLVVHTKNFNRMIEEVMALTQEGILIQKCYRVTGLKCLMLRIKAYSSNDLTRLHDSLLQIEGMIKPKRC